VSGCSSLLNESSVFVSHFLPSNKFSNIFTTAAAAAATTTTTLVAIVAQFDID